MLHLAVSSAYLLLFLAQQRELQVDVVELPGELTTGPFDHHCSPLQPDLDYKNHTTEKFQLSHTDKTEITAYTEVSTLFLPLSGRSTV